MGKTCFNDLHGKKVIMGMIHLIPMPGTPLYEDGNMDKMIKKAVSDALTLKENGAQGGLVQSVDVFYPNTDDTDYARVAALAAVTARVRNAVGPEFVLGAQLMYNCITPSLAACKAAGADWTRCAALVGDTDTFVGRVEAQPLKVAEYRKKIEAENIALLVESQSKHHKGAQDQVALARTALHLGADAIEVCDDDFKINEELVLGVKSIGDVPVILGGSTNVNNCKDRLRYADGALVGTAFEGGKWGGPIIGEIVRDYCKNIRELEEELAKQ